MNHTSFYGTVGSVRGASSIRAHRSPQSTQQTSPGLEHVLNILQEQNKQMHQALQDMKVQALEQNESTQSVISSLQSEINALKQQVQESTTTGKKSTKIPKELSKLVRTLHERSEKKFSGSERYSATCNTDVASFLQKQIRESGRDYSDYLVKHAVYRYYESRRRVTNDARPERVLQVQTNKKNTARRSLQRQLYDRQSKYLKENELRHWKEIDFQCMSEESAHEDENGDRFMMRHSHSWRSDYLNRLYKKADERMTRATEKPRARRGNHFKADRREYGDIAVSSPPSGVVNWAIRTPVTTNISSEVSITPVLSASQTPLHVQDHQGSLQVQLCSSGTLNPGHDTPTISRASTSRALFPSSIQNATQQPHDKHMYTFSELVSQDSAYAVFSSNTDSDY